MAWVINGEKLLPSYGNDYKLTGRNYWPIVKTGSNYNTADNTITWSIEANRQGDIEGDAVITETIPAGQTFVVSDVGDTEEERLKNSVTLSLNTYNNVTSTGEIDKVEVIEPDDPDTEETVVKIYLKDLTGYIYDQYRNTDGTLNSTGADMVRNSKWVNYGWVTLTLKTALTEKALLELDEKTELTNTATINGGVLEKDKYTSTATVKPGISTISKTMASQDFPAYVKFVLDINKSKMNLDAEKTTVTVYDKMGTGLSLAPDHEDYMTVYDMSDATEDDYETTATKLSVGENEGDYSVNILDGGNSFELTVPDEKYIKVVYWAKFEGVAGTSYDLTNTADFYYEGVVSDESSRAWAQSLKVQFSDASAMSNPYINVYKVDQSGNPLAGVTFQLYKVTKNDDGTVTLGNKLAEKTTGSNGKLYFGHRESSDETLEKDTLYCIVEASAPAGYALAEPYYFEFPDIYDSTDDGYVVNANKQATHEATHPTSVTVNDKLPGETINVVNTLSLPSLTIPLNKTVNGKNTESGVDFTFTLKQTSGSAYTSDTAAADLTNTGITVTNDGSGTVEFDTLNFPSAGTYTFTLAEEDTTANGFTKDSTVYKVEVKVGVDSTTNQLSVTEAKFYTGNDEDGYTEKGDLQKGDVPTFDNTFSLEGSFEVTLKKEITNWPEGVDMPAFTFEVYRNGEKMDGVSNNTDGTVTNDKDGNITFSIPITQDDLGTDQRYVIKEVAGDSKLFTYDDGSVVIAVDIGLDKDGNLVGTNIVNKTKDGTFTNTYSATGSFTLTGTKYLYGPEDVQATVKNGQFTFTVKEGNSIVATGKTKAGGEIEFTPINYVAAQIGDHTYTITEDKGSEMFQNYNADPVTVVVTVSDDGTGTGKLTATVKSVNGSEENKDITFTNTCTYIVPTGINLDTLPYVLVLVFALCGGAALVLSRRKRRQSKQH
jgi:pilin isopeptide linkage protein